MQYYLIILLHRMGRGTNPNDQNHIVIVPNASPSSTTLQNSSFPINSITDTSTSLTRTTTSANSRKLFSIRNNHNSSLSSSPPIHTTASSSLIPLSSTCPGYKYCCCSCYPLFIRKHPYIWTIIFLFLLFSIIGTGYIIYPRTNITFQITDQKHIIRQMISASSLLPFFEIQLLNNITITNPNFISFQLTDILFTVHEEQLLLSSSSINNPQQQQQEPFLKLVSSPSSITVLGKSPQEPKINRYLVGVSISTNNKNDNNNNINLSSALNCARAMYGDNQCKLLIEVSMQPIYLGLGKGIIPRQIFTFPLAITSNQNINK